jgi:VWFA-related protein
VQDPSRALVASVAIVALVVIGRGPIGVAQQPTQTPTFIGRLDLVRTEVSIIENRSGKPVTGLTQSDFTILENGKPQAITSFVALNADDLSAPPANRRVFLIVFGAGYLPGPIKPYDGAIEFLRTKLKPNDLAAVMVWNRVTALTTDHERLATLVDRIRQLPEAVFISVLRDIARLRDLSPETQAAIDAWIDPLDTRDGFLQSATALLIGMDQYRQEQYDAWPWNRRIAGRDLLKVYAGIEFLRRVEGQKHLILLTVLGLHPVIPYDPTAYLHSADDDHQLAVQANDDGVALDIIHTEGTSSDAGFGRLASAQTARESGGQFTSVRTAAQGLARIDAATRNGYVIGYVPGNPALDDKYRNVEVRTTRKDVTLVYRRGYTARSEQLPVDPRELMATMRLRDAAASSSRSTLRFTDIGVNAIATGRAGANGREIHVEATIESSKLRLARSQDEWTGNLDLLVVCTDARGNVVGWKQQPVDVRMSFLERTAGSPFSYVMTVPVTGNAGTVQVIAYEYASDRLGATTVVIK